MISYKDFVSVRAAPVARCASFASCLAFSTVLPVVSIAAETSENESKLLERIIVTSGHSGDGWKGAPLSVYETPGNIGIIGRDNFVRLSSRDTQDIFDDVAGVVAESRPDNPGLNISIRGLSDQNRITMALDGARQNFLQNGHGQAASAYFDPALMRQIVLDKTTGANALSAGSLGGYVNFRTLLSEDLIKDGRTSGGEVNFATGSNAYRSNGSGAFSWRLAENIAVTAAISHKKTGRYEPGKKYPYQFDEGYFLTKFIGSENTSGLLKTEIDIDNHQKLTLGWVGYNAKFQTGSTQYINRAKVANHTFTANYTYDPDSDLIDFSANLWTNRMMKHDHRPKRRDADYGAFDNHYGLNTTGGDIANRSKVTTGFGDFTFDYGTTAFLDDARTKQISSQEDDNPTGSWFGGATPSGKRGYYSAFSKTEFKPADYQWLSLTGGLRYDHYDLKGKTYVPDFEDPEVQAMEQTDVHKDGGKLLPSVTLGITPLEGLQFFAGYDYSYRPPTTMETLFWGSHVGGGMLNMPNTALIPESARTAQIGFNIHADDLFLGGDSLRFKYAYFNRQVDDLIARSFRTTPDMPDMAYVQYVNIGGTSRMFGHELEMNYDAGSFYAGLSATALRYKLAKRFEMSSYGMTDLAQQIPFAMPPKYKLTIDAGIRLFDEKLTLGGKLRHSGKAVHIGPKSQTSKLWTKPFTVADVYGSIAFDEDRRVDFGIDNLMDRYYVDYMSHVASPGRTYKINFSTKF
ncbi:TonB-dependent receptor domain-containing protein [Limoniibacter endophyticus]|uniref:Ligand-gated channel n=1 Tax=Limoniibacter endophyticus TaxID=1565040 RepID=A0A8J3DPE8_9HYPH|nr:TonB-dependent receptor [Limoniibacter endophyticus]GHC76744.1 ligand-gated channel [Limoniibacter endophyticus]